MDLNDHAKGGALQTIVLCSNTGACPTVSVFAEHLEIRDDHGGAVRLTKGEFKLLLERATEIS